MTELNPAVIVDAVRTPSGKGKPGGALSGVHPIDLLAGTLEALLELAARDEAAGLGDAPWPPHFQKTIGEAPRVAPSRARATGATPRPPRARMPLVTVANSPDKAAALAGLERWKIKHAAIADR